MSIATVTVACKIPNGLILRVFDMVDHDVPVMGGGTKTTKKAVQRGGMVKVNGPATPFGQAPRSQIVGGYALTHNVPAEFFKDWLKQNAEHDAVKNGLIFGHEKFDAVHGRAEDGKKVVSGMHPLIPDKDPRIPRGPNPNVSAPSTADLKN
ncbi:MAG: hypothetical protein E6Q98_16025 [Rhodospirillaceae bacterium]|nr:MAG: hypothetical protein E6Q98_16025 [Rhodospirillaceae bacterium]